jgi:hypothetical protein
MVSSDCLAAEGWESSQRAMRRLRSTVIVPVVESWSLDELRELGIEGHLNPPGDSDGE